MSCTFLPEEIGLKTTGRTFFRDGKLHLTWVGTSFSLCVKGSDRVLISLEKFNDEVERYIKITADKRSQVHAVSGSTQNIIVTLGEGDVHRIDVARITESTADIVISKITLYGNAPEIVPFVDENKKKIEFIGDSLTAGYGNLGDASTPVYYAYEQDCTKAFSGLTAKMLDMEYSLVCVSGKGLSHNWDGSTEFMIPEFYRYISRETKELWDFSSWVPDIIVINAGTNDATSKTPAEEVAEAAKKFVKFVREHNPNAQIIYAFGFTNKIFCDPLQKVVAELAKTDDKLHFMRFGDVYGKDDEKGANGHPNVRSHVHAAKELYDFMVSEGLVK